MTLTECTYDQSYSITIIFNTVFLPIALDALGSKTRNHVFFQSRMNAVAIHLIHAGKILIYNGNSCCVIRSAGIFEPNLKGNLLGYHFIHLRQKALSSSSNILVT